MSIDPATTAVVLIEYQDEFTSKGGALHGAVENVMTETNMLDNTVSLVAWARKHGVAVMHVSTTFAAGCGELTMRSAQLKATLS